MFTFDVCCAGNSGYYRLWRYRSQDMAGTYRCLVLCSVCDIVLCSSRCKSFACIMALLCIVGIDLRIVTHLMFVYCREFLARALR
jgi:hypothetical protein